MAKGRTGMFLLALALGFIGGFAFISMAAQGDPPAMMFSSR